MATVFTPVTAPVETFQSSSGNVERRHYPFIVSPHNIRTQRTGLPKAIKDLSLRSVPN